MDCGVKRVYTIGIWCCTGVLLSCAALPKEQRRATVMDEVVGSGNWELMVAATDAVLPQLETGPVVCLSLMEGPADVTFQASVLAEFEELRVVSPDDCPRTYARMIRNANAPEDPPPPGHLDPYRIKLSRPQFDQPGHAWIEVELMKGMSGRAYLCSVHTRSEQPQAHCRATRHWVH